MTLLRYILSILIVCNIPSIVLISYGDSAGSLMTSILYVLLLLYYVLVKKHKPIYIFLILGLTYFVISGFVFVPEYKYFVRTFLKFMILIIVGAEIVRRTSYKELSVYLFIGSLSILVHALYFPDDFGRYSGFYLNPNAASFVSLLGYCLTFKISNKMHKYIFAFVFTVTGIMTFSRFFLILWLLVSVLAIVSNRKNGQIFILGIAALTLIMSLASILHFNTERFAFIEGLFEKKVNTTTFTEDSRTVQWTNYLNDIYSSPIYGNGYEKFSGGINTQQGVHNTYLKVIGEAGIIPFIIICAIYILLILKSLKYYKIEPQYFLFAISMASILMVMHNFFTSDYLVFASLWVLVQLNMKDEDQEEDQDENDNEFNVLNIPDVLS